MAQVADWQSIVISDSSTLKQAIRKLNQAAISFAWYAGKIIALKGSLVIVTSAKHI